MFLLCEEKSEDGKTYSTTVETKAKASRVSRARWLEYTTIGIRQNLILKMFLFCPFYDFLTKIGEQEQSSKRRYSDPYTHI